MGISGDKIKLVTFGEPRLSDSTFSVNMNTLIRKQQRYVYNEDLVPHLPPYKKVGAFGVNIWSPQGKQSAFHHSAEVFLLKDFQNKTSEQDQFHYCGYDDKTNEKGEECSNAVQNLGNLADILRLLKGNSEAMKEHVNYWPQYSSFAFCFKSTATTTAAANTIDTEPTTASNLII